MTKKLTYLAGPYSHPDPSVRATRFRRINIAAGELIRRGDIIFSPISHSHFIAEDCDIHGHDIWMAQDRAFLELSEKMIVVTLDGWRESKGVQMEIAMAAGAGIAIEYLCWHRWGIDGAHSNEYCKKCFVPFPGSSDSEDVLPLVLKPHPIYER